MRRTLKQGDRCPMAAVVQALLRSHGYMPLGHTAMDDEYGTNCATAAQAFQRETKQLGIHELEGLVDDGEIGNLTLSAFRIRWGVDLTSLPDSYWPQA